MKRNTDHASDERRFTRYERRTNHHAINTVPKECLIRITKAEDGGIGARGPWEPVRTGFTPGQENEFMIKWLKGEHIKIKV